jgi:glucose dehydrogenase
MQWNKTQRQLDEPARVVERATMVNKVVSVNPATGEDVWSGPLPRRSTGTPMTYRAKNGRQYVVIAIGTRSDAELIAFALK